MKTATQAIVKAEWYHDIDSQAWGGLCQKFCRTCYQIGSGNGSAKAQLEENKRKGGFHKYTGDTDDIPFGAVVFSDHPGGSKYGHIFLAGGRFADGGRTFWSNDIRDYGGIDPVRLSAFTNIWGHKILGWGEYINGVKLPLGDSPNEKKRKKKAQSKPKPPKGDGNDWVIVVDNVVTASKRHQRGSRVTYMRSVKRYQYALNKTNKRLGLWKGNNIPMDGIFGQRTENATRLLERHMGVKVNGVPAKDVVTEAAKGNRTYAK